MTKTRVDTELTDSRRRMWHCLGRIASTAAVALAGLVLALGGPAPNLEIALVIAVWLWLAVSVIVGFVRMACAFNGAVSRESANINPFYFLPRPPRICAWAGVLLLVVATAALFAAGEAVLAATMEIFLFLRLAMSLVPDSEFMPAKKKYPFEQDHMPIASGPGAFGVTAIAGTVWLALGSPPPWAESMILTYIWIVAVMLVFGQSMIALGIVSVPLTDKHSREQLRRSGTRSDLPSPPPITPEPLRTTHQQFNMWFWRASWIVIAWALWAAGQPLLAGLYLFGQTLKLAVRVRLRRMKHGDTARIDFASRAVHFIIWWPLVAAATSVVTAFVVPFIVMDNIWRWLFGSPETSKPNPQTDWEREARLERARIRRAAASYRLREAFGKPDGFVYFMGSEPHQHKHFLGPSGLLAGLGDRVVARDYRQHVLKTRTTWNWKAFQQSPEGALLHAYGVSNMRRDLPFIAVVPPRGLVQVFRLSEPYRARRRDGGVALARAEMEVRAAIMGQLNVGGEFFESIRG